MTLLLENLGNGATALVVIVLAFAFGFGCGSTTLGEKWEAFLLSSSWNLYTGITLSYITIRIFDLFVDPILQQWANKNGLPSEPHASPLKRNTMTARDLDVFSKLKRIDEEGEEDLVSPGARGKSTKQPINMSGKFQLVKNENFEAFLIAQGLPWMLARAADKARPTHSIDHIGKWITIKIEGIIESSSTYEINGEPVESEVRGRLFADQVTYLTYEDLGETPPEGGEDGENSADFSQTLWTSPNTPNNSAIGARSSSNNGSENNSEWVPGQLIASEFEKASAGFDEFKHNLQKNLDKAFQTPQKKNGAATTSNSTPKRRSSATRYARAKSAPLSGSSRSSERSMDPLRPETAPATAPTQNNNDNDASMPMGLTGEQQRTAQGNLGAGYGRVGDNKENENAAAAANSHTSEPPVRNAGHICGIKTTKRAINDGYTVTVCRKLLPDKSQIIMLSSVVFDDPSKEDIRARQIFERKKQS